ncbi:MAG: hypothetical protein NVSMB25_04280 [Thermoleophilaceae bacterium]
MPTISRVVAAPLAFVVLCLLAPAGASAATFTSGSASLAISPATAKALKRGRVAVSSKKVNLAFTTSTIDMISGKASGLGASGSLTFKAQKKSVKVTNFKIDGTTLSASAGGKRLTFPLTISPAKVADQAGNTAVSVSGVTVKLTKAGAAILNNGLSRKGRRGKKVRAFKQGILGTLSYSGTARELQVTSGVATLFNNPSYYDKQTADGIAVSADAPATPVAPTPAHPRGGISLPATPGGTLEASGTGSIGVGGAIRNTKGSTSLSFANPVFVLGPSPFLNATTALGSGQVATVDLSTLTGRTLSITPSEATFSLSTATVRLTGTTAGGLNAAFCNTPGSCPGGTFNAGDAIGTADLSLKLK